jgi:hypothetical protein
MKTQHESLVALEDKCRKMALIIKDKKKRRQELRDQQNVQEAGLDRQFTKEDLAKLDLDLKKAE